MAQIFSTVSPAMHQEYELDYVNRMYERFGLVYYGCCEPLHHKMALMNAIPRPGSRGKKMAAIPGTVPSNPGALTGCPFAPRCEFAFARCSAERPGLFKLGDDHRSACYLVDSVSSPVQLREKRERDS